MLKDLVLNISKFFYDVCDDGIYRHIKILGIKITIKPLRLRLKDIENRLSETRNIFNKRLSEYNSTLLNINKSIFEVKELLFFNEKIESYNEKVKYVARNSKLLFIEIETHNRCNNNCSFCPVSVGNDIREYKQMSEELFLKIINNLEDLKYCNALSLFSNNEPFLDSRMIKFLKLAKERLPNAYHYIYTNGSVLTPELFIEAEKYLDLIVIDNYNDSLELNGPVKKIYELFENNRAYKDKVRIDIRKKTEILSSRGGEAPNRKDSLKTIKNLCVLPFVQLIIRPDGKISLCCNDAYGKMTLGDINKDKIEDIWNGEKYNEVRANIIKGRSYIDLCKCCDASPGHIDISYNHMMYGKRIMF